MVKKVEKMADFCGFLGVGRYVWGKMVFLRVLFDGGAAICVYGLMGWVFDGVRRSKKGDENFFLNKIFYFVGGSDRNNFYFAKNGFFIRG